MPAYCLFNVHEVIDPETVERYRSRVHETVLGHGVLGGRCDSVEGQWRQGFPVLLRFASLAQAHAWYGSEDYGR